MTEVSEEISELAQRIADFGERAIDDPEHLLLLLRLLTVTAGGVVGTLANDQSELDAALARIGDVIAKAAKKALDARMEKPE